jgi:hypothetical protein
MLETSPVGEDRIQGEGFAPACRPGADVRQFATLLPNTPDKKPILQLALVVQTQAPGSASDAKSTWEH